jgi:hypothetical protein
MPDILQEIARISWGIWLAGAALSVGVGTFFDEYYVGNPARERARAHLASGLKRLEDAPSKLKTLMSVLRELKPILWYFLWGLIPLTVYEIGHRIPAGKYHGLADSLIVLALLLGCWYSILLLLMLIPLSVLVVYMVGAITFYTSKLILWVLFKPAADPTKSPFKFASTMLGLWVLLAKFLVEVLKWKT